MASQKNNLVLPLKNHNGDPSGCDSRGQPMVKDSHRNALCTDEEAERPQKQQPMKDITNAVINQKTGKRNRSVSTCFGNNNSPRKRCATVINNGEHIAPSSKRQKRSQASVSYKEHESESEMEDVHDTQNVSYKDDTENANVEIVKPKPKKKTQRRKRPQAKKKNTMKCLVEKSMQSHGDNTAYIWMQDGSSIHKYELMKTKSRSSGQKRLYKKTKLAKRYGGKYEARYQAISGWKPDNVTSKECLPEVVEVTSWEVMAGREVGYEDYKSYLECIIRVALDENFLENIRQNNNENEQYKQAFDKIDSMIKNFMAKIRSRAWKEPFKSITERYPSKTCQKIIETRFCKEICEVCQRKKSIASCIVKFEGPTYDPETLKEISEEGECNEKSFKIGGDCDERTDIYHSLCHYHIDLLKKCKEKVEEVRFPEADADDVVYEILTTECRWVEDEHYLFDRLLLQSYQRFNKYQRMRTQKYHDRWGKCFTV